jgi:hypothetical protein
MNTSNHIAGYVWAAVVIGGPILLGLAILFAKIRNGRRREGLGPDGNIAPEPPKRDPSP